MRTVVTSCILYAERDFEFYLLYLIRPRLYIGTGPHDKPLGLHVTFCYLSQRYFMTRKDEEDTQTLTCSTSAILCCCIVFFFCILLFLSSVGRLAVRSPVTRPRRRTTYKAFAPSSFLTICYVIGQLVARQRAASSERRRI